MAENIGFAKDLPSETKEKQEKQQEKVYDVGGPSLGGPKRDKRVAADEGIKKWAGVMGFSLISDIGWGKYNRSNPYWADDARVVESPYGYWIITDDNVIIDEGIGGPFAERQQAREAIKHFQKYGPRYKGD